MRIQIGVGNAVTTVTSVSAKTITFSGAYNFDISTDQLSIYNVTRSAYVFWQDPQGTANRVTTDGAVATTVAGAITQTITFVGDFPASAADGDVLLIYLECPDVIATYNAIVTT